MFPDYRVPQILHHLGVFEYSEELIEVIKSKKVIPHADQMEIEIRAATVECVEQLRKHLNLKGNILSIEIDWILWQTGEQKLKEMEPHHQIMEKTKRISILSKISIVSLILPYFGYLHQCAILMRSLDKVTANLWKEYYSILLKMDQSDYQNKILHTYSTSSKNSIEKFKIKRLKASMQPGQMKKIKGITRDIQIFIKYLLKRCINNLYEIWRNEKYIKNYIFKAQLIYYKISFINS